MRAPVIDLAERRFRTNIIKLHRLGPRVLGELLCEIGRRRMSRVEIEALTSSFASLDPTLLRQLGADQWPRDS